MAEFKQSAQALAERFVPAQGAQWLSAQRQSGSSAFAGAIMPSRRVEQFKYNNFNNLLKQDVQLAGESNLEAAKALGLEVPGLNAHRLVFVDGRFQPELSSEANADISVCNFSSADDEQRQFIDQQLGKLIPEQDLPFVALADSLADDGVLLQVAAGSDLQTPVQLLSIRTTTGVATPRLLVQIGAGARASVIEQYQCVEGVEAFDSAVSEIDLGDNAEVHHYRVALGNDSYTHIGAAVARQGRDSRYHAYVINTGGAINRLDHIVDVQGSGSDSKMFGAYLSRAKQQVDIHLCVEHAVPHCTSQETYRGMAAESGKAVFNGRIQIHKDAQKTDAQLSCRNLLLSNKAELNAKPELEIYADDVKCAHGATVGQLDPASIFYLRTRGISEEKARALLSYGFINEVLLAMPLEPLADFLRGPLDAFFANQNNS
ncbi:MAG: Fe-S cluster assembly protein SufD [Granulosicoccaceae bacterium]